MKESREVTALKASIKHWENMRDGKESLSNYRSEYCACCEEFSIDDDCGACPIAIKDGINICENTPWGEYRNCLVVNSQPGIVPTIKNTPIIVPIADKMVKHLNSVLVWQLEKELSNAVAERPVIIKKPASERFEVTGSDDLVFSGVGSRYCCGEAIGIHVNEYGEAGGVMDVAVVQKLITHLIDWMVEYNEKKTNNDYCL